MSEPLDDLRRRAKAMLALDAEEHGRADRDPAAIRDELSVHRVELQMQNEELRLANAALRTARDRYRALFDRASSGYVIVSPTGVVEEANPMAATLLGAARPGSDRPAVAKAGLASHVDAGSRERLREKLRAAFDQAGRPVRCELKLRRRAAPRTHALAEIVALSDEDGAVSSALVTLTDVTPLRQERVRVADREARVQSVLAHAGYGVVIADPWGRIQELDAAAEQIFGRPTDEARGLHLDELLDGFPDAMRRGALARWECVGRRADGEPVDLLVAGGPVPGRGEIALVVADVTERRRFERGLRETQKMESVGRMAAGIAHDMNNVLMAIFGSVERAWRHTEPGGDPADALERVRARLVEIRHVASGASAVMRRLTHFARDAGGHAGTSLDAIVRDVADMLRPLLGEDIELAVVLDAGDARTTCPAGGMEQIIMNLAVNAREAMPTGGRLEIVTGRSGRERARITVRDSGPGMDPSVRDRLFERFFTTKRDGTGFGLSVVKGLVDETGGRLSVESEPGRGTTFVIELPLVAPGAALPGTPAVEPRRPLTVLLVEDDPLVRAGVASMLERGGHSVIAADDADDALAQIRSAERLDVVLTDVVLQGGTSGPSLGRHVQALHRDARVLYMSGFSQFELVRRGHLSESVFVLQKPFSYRQLGVALAGVVNPLFEDTAADAPDEALARPTVLLVEDDDSIREALEELLCEDGYEVEAVAAIASAMARGDAFDVLVCDDRLPDGRGVDLARTLHALSPTLGVVVMSAHTEDDDPALLALLAEPRTVFLRKPVATAEVISAIEAVRARGG